MHAVIALIILLIPSTVLAASTATPAPAEPTGLAGLITALTALFGALGALIAAVRGNRKAQQADARAHLAQDVAAGANARSERAMAYADRLANAHLDGVVVLVTAPGATSPCRTVLEANGWTVRVCELTQAELDAGMAAKDPWLLLPGETMRQDLAVADAVVLEGFDVPAMDLLAHRSVRELVRSGASVVMATGGHNHRYNLGPWGVFAVASNGALTTEAAVRASLARREQIARLQGVRPGQLADARQRLIAGPADE